MKNTSIRLKMIPLAVATLAVSMSGIALSAPVTYGNITLDATYALNGGSTVNGMADAQANISQFGGGADFYLYRTEGSNNAFFHTYGFTSGSTYFGARASGEGVFSAYTRSTYSQTFTNNSGSAQSYNFNFNVDQGEVGVTGAGAGFANLMLRVSKTANNITTVMAQDSTTIDTTAPTLCADTDFGFGNPSYMTCGSASSSNASGGAGIYDVSMGVIAAGASFTLDYDIIATVAGNLSAGQSVYYQACNSGYGDAQRGALQANAAQEYGGPTEGQLLCEFQQFFPGSAIARSGDPFNGPGFGNLNGPSAFNSANFQMTSVDVNGVPEPGSVALVGLALAGLAATRRKRRA